MISRNLMIAYVSIAFCRRYLPLSRTRHVKVEFWLLVARGGEQMTCGRPRLLCFAETWKPLGTSLKVNPPKMIDLQAIYSFVLDSRAIVSDEVS